MKDEEEAGLVDRGSRESGKDDPEHEADSSFSPSSSPWRLARYLARCGIASRRRAEELISSGRVTVNGAVATDLGRRVRPDGDRVIVDGVVVSFASEELTLIHHKPRGVLVSRSDPHHGGQTVFDLLPGEFREAESRLAYAGRLDRESEGLLILSTDGDLVHGLVHPRFHVEKEYIVTLDGVLSAAQVGELARGVELDDGPTQPCVVERLRDRRARVVLCEGRNRQVRRMMAVVGRRVTRLVRTRVGGIMLGDLKAGEFRRALAEELQGLHKETGEKQDVH